MPDLSPRQQLILEFIRGYRADHSYMPSVREIQAACGISSTSVVDYNIRILEREGYLHRSPDISRGLELVGGEPGRGVEVVAIPLIGAIAAGAPIPVPEATAWRDQDVETVSLPPELTPRHPEQLYALRVKGHSMIDALIDDGDVVVLRPASDVRDGEMVAAWLKLEEETTLKRIYREGDRIRLQPANVQMDPIIVPAENVEVQGKVVAVIRTLE